MSSDGIVRIGFQVAYMSLVLSRMSLVIGGTSTSINQVRYFVLVKSDPVVKEMLGALDRFQIPYEYRVSRGRVIDRWKITGGRLKDQPIREFTDEEKALIMRYKIEQGGQR